MKITKKRLKASAIAYLFLLPWLIPLFIFVVYPFFYGLIISLYESNYLSTTFVGLQNFTDLFSDERFLKSIVTTLRFGLIILPFTVIISLWVANTINHRRKFIQNFAKVSFYIPVIVSTVSLAIVWKFMFGSAYGLSVTITKFLGLPTINWIGSTTGAIVLCSMLVITINIGQPIILFSAAINNIPISYYEAAEIDGASRFRQFFFITLPLIMPTTTYVLIINTIGCLQIFTVPYMMTGGGPNYATTPVLLLLYRNAFEYGRYGYAAAMGVILFFIIAIISLVQYKLTKSDIQY